MKSSPRILYLTPSWPNGPAFGGQLRALNVGRALKTVGEVTLAVVSSDEPGDDAMGRTTAEFRLAPPVRINPQSHKSLPQKFRWALDPHFLNVHGCVADSEDRARLLNTFADFDLIWVLNSRTPNILQQWQWPKSVLDIDDIPSNYQRSVWQNGAALSEKLKAGVLMLLSRRRERLFKTRFSMLAVCSELDRRYLGAGPHIHVIPNGFERPAHEPIRKPAIPPRFGFIGLFSHEPNLDGMRWFVRECWPQIKRALPDAKLRLVGKETDGPLKPIGADIDALGWVSDPAAEIATWSAMVTPIRHGAGTRIKIAEAFSRKCPVVSTNLGAYGYDVKHDRDLLLADTPADFGAACVSLAKDNKKGSQLADNAYELFLKNWTWDAIAPKVWAAAEDCLRRSS